MFTRKHYSTYRTSLYHNEHRKKKEAKMQNATQELSGQLLIVPSLHLPKTILRN